MSKTFERADGDVHRESDGRVPLASATLGNVEMRYVKGVHGGLTNIPAVYNDVFNWLNQRPLTLAKTPKGALSLHLSGGTTSSAAPHLDGTAQAARDDPGYWNDIAYAPAILDGLDESIKDNPAEFHSVRIL